MKTEPIATKAAEVSTANHRKEERFDYRKLGHSASRERQLQQEEEVEMEQEEARKKSTSTFVKIEEFLKSDIRNRNKSSENEKDGMLPLDLSIRPTSSTPMTSPTQEDLVPKKIHAFREQEDGHGGHADTSVEIPEPRVRQQPTSLAPPPPTNPASVPLERGYVSAARPASVPSTASRKVEILQLSRSGNAASGDDVEVPNPVSIPHAVPAFGAPRPAPSARIPGRCRASQPHPIALLHEKPVSISLALFYVRHGGMGGWIASPPRGRQVERSLLVSILREDLPSVGQPDAPPADAHGRAAVQVQVLRAVVQHLVQPAAARPQHPQQGENRSSVHCATDASVSRPTSTAISRSTSRTVRTCSTRRDRPTRTGRRPPTIEAPRIPTSTKSAISSARPATATRDP